MIKKNQTYMIFIYLFLIISIVKSYKCNCCGIYTYEFEKLDFKLAIEKIDDFHIIYFRNLNDTIIPIPVDIKFLSNSLKNYEECENLLNTINLNENITTIRKKCVDYYRSKNVYIESHILDGTTECFIVTGNKNNYYISYKGNVVFILEYNNYFNIYTLYDENDGEFKSKGEIKLKE